MTRSPFHLSRGLSTITRPFHYHVAFPHRGSLMTGAAYDRGSLMTRSPFHTGAR